MGALWRDVQFGIRMIARNLSLSAVTALTLALGIGATTALFSVLEAVALRPLPFADSSRLVALEGTDSRRPGSKISTSFLDLRDWREATRAFEQIAGAVVREFDIRDAEGNAERISGGLVTANYFSVLGVRPQRGRFFAVEEDRLPAGLPVVVLSHGLWQGRFGGSAAIVGQAISLNNMPYTVIGIAPQGFEGHSGGATLWTPITVVPPILQNYNRIRPARWITDVVGRLSAGTALPQAQEEMNAITRRLGEQYLATNATFGVRLTPLAEQLLGASRPLVVLSFAACGLVLLIACANVSNLLLSKAIHREREMALRSALGAGRGAIVRQVLTETVLLSLLGFLPGIAIAHQLLEVAPLFLTDLPSYVRLEIHLTALGFALGMSLLAGCAAGLGPALRVPRADLRVHLQAGGRGGTGGTRSRRLQDALVAGQLAMALILLAGAGLLLRSLENLLALDVGFQPRGVATSRVMLRDTDYSVAEALTFARRVRAELQDRPGVEAAAVGLHIPLDGFRASAKLIREEESEADPSAGLEVAHHPVSEDYFRLYGIPLLRGRSISEGDTEESPRVIVLSQGVAQRLWPGQDPLGRRVRFVREDQPTPWLTVVGIAGDVRFTTLTVPPQDSLDIYLPMEQALFPPRFLGIGVRGAGVGTNLIRDVIRKLDAGLPIFAASDLEAIVSQQAQRNRNLAQVLTGIAALALTLAAIGLHGVISQAVGRRTKEIGVRMALGAGRGAILRMVLAHVMTLTALGLAIGVAGALLTGRALASLLFEVQGSNLAVLGAAAAVLAVVALLASALPAWRSTRVDPIVALRHE